MTDLKILVYRCLDDVECLEKRLAGYDQQLLDNLQQIKSMSEEKTIMAKKIEDLEQAARAVVDMVDLVEEQAADERSLLEWLRGAPAMSLRLPRPMLLMCLVCSSPSGRNLTLIDYLLGWLLTALKKNLKNILCKWSQLRRRLLRT